MANDRSSKENSWYFQDIGGHIEPESRKLLEKYSLNAPENVDSHIYKLVGCCVAQELRGLAHADVPSTQLYGSDLDPTFISTSYALFNDTSKFHGTLVQANVFDADLFSTAWAGWAGTFGIVNANLFLHLFDASYNLSVAMDEVNSNPLVDVVFDKKLGKVLQVRGRYLLRSQLLAVNECIIPEFHLAMDYR